MFKQKTEELLRLNAISEDLFHQKLHRTLLLGVFEVICKEMKKQNTKTAEKERFITSLLDRNKTNKDEYYYSFAENSFTELGIPQEPYFYMNFQGDRPDVNNGSIPMSMLKVFDHYSFRMKTGGLTGRNYDLILNIKPR